MKRSKNLSPLIIITGAAGFIGSAIVRHLNDEKRDNLLLVDDLKSSDKWKNLLGKRFNRLMSKHQLFSWLEESGEEVEAIIHMGACSDTLVADGDYIMENNYRYTQRLAIWALAHGVRFIYASSAATYGDGKLGFSDDIDRLEELRPLNLYGFSKHLFDLWAKREGIFNQIVGLKYFNVFGPNEGHKGHMASMVYKMFPKVHCGEWVELFRSNHPDFGDGQQKRDFIYVKEAAAMTCQFLDTDVSGLFNIGRGEPVTWKRLAEALFRSLNLEPKIRYIEMPPNLAAQYQSFTCADMEKYCSHFPSINRASPFSISIENGVMDYVQSHLVKGERW